MNHRWGVVLLFVVLLLGIPVHHAWAKQGEKTPVDYVNPYIGNISHLLVPTFPTIHSVSYTHLTLPNMHRRTNRQYIRSFFLMIRRRISL